MAKLLLAGPKHLTDFCKDVGPDRSDTEECENR